MENITLKAAIRKNIGKKVNALRKEGIIPAILYGHDTDNVNIEVPYNNFIKVLKSAGESTFVDLAVDEKEPVKVLIHDYQREPVSGNVSHVDFYKINMNESLHIRIAIEFTNEAPAVTALGGILLTNLEEIEAKCLPKDLVKNIEVDLSVLKTFDDSIHVKDLTIPEGIEVLANPDDTVAKVAPPRTEEELEELDKKPEGDVGDVEVEGEEAKEGEEGTEDDKDKKETKDSDSAKSSDDKSDDKKKE